MPANDLAEARALHLRALTASEWTAFNENSMASHNGSELNADLDQPRAFAEQALSKPP